MKGRLIFEHVIPDCGTFNFSVYNFCLNGSGKIAHHVVHSLIVGWDRSCELRRDRN